MRKAPCDFIRHLNEGKMKVFISFRNQVVCLLTLLSLSAMFANSPLPLSAEADEATHSVKVYSVSSEVTAPELLPIDLSRTLRTSCREKESGDVQLSLIVDETGKPRNVFFVRALALNLDQLALQVVLADRFTPGKHDGVPVAVAMLIDLKLEGCVVGEMSDSGKETMQEHLKSAPVQKLSPDKNVPPNLALLDMPQPGNESPYQIGNGVSAPVPLKTSEAKYTQEAKRKSFQGKCLVSVVIDANGLPQNPKVIQPVGYGLDESTIAAIRKFRFKPSIKDGQPVAVELKIQMKFMPY